MIYLLYVGSAIFDRPHSRAYYDIIVPTVDSPLVDSRITIFG